MQLLPLPLSAPVIPPKAWSKFARDRRGATAMMFALTLIPATVMVGAAVDLARGLNYSTKLKIAADAAALAAATITSDPADPTNTNVYPQRLAAAQAAFNANIVSQTSVTGVQMALSELPTGVQVTASGQVGNIFGGLLGTPYTQLSALSETTLLLQRQQMEIAFVLDNTGSMAQLNKMPLLKASMHNFLNKLQKAASTVGDVKVSLVPFDTKVKIDPVFAAGKPWMRQTLGDLSNWSGCIMDRVQPYDVNATAPALITPDTLFDAVDNNLVVFPNAAPSPCNLQPILPLTSNFSSYGAAIWGRKGRLAYIASRGDCKR